MTQANTATDTITHWIMNYIFGHYAWRKYSVLPNFSQLLYLGMWHNMRSMKTTVLRAWHLEEQHISQAIWTGVSWRYRNRLKRTFDGKAQIWTWHQNGLPQFLLKEAGGVVWEVSTNSPTHSPLTGHTGCSDFQEWLFIFLVDVNPALWPVRRKDTHLDLHSELCVIEGNAISPTIAFPMG